METNNTIDNKQKQENYREQFIRLKRAMDNKFYLEAVFIEYAIMEDRTMSVIVHSGKSEAYLKNKKEHQITITSKIRHIQRFTSDKKNLLCKYFGDSLLSDMLAWKDKRNDLIHALLNQSLTTEILEETAAQGEMLCKTLRNRATSYKKALAARAKKE